MDDAERKIMQEIEAEFAAIDADIHEARQGADGRATDSALDHIIQALHGLRDRQVKAERRLRDLEDASDM